MKAALGVWITCMPFRGSDMSVPALALSKWIPGFDFAFNVVVLAKRSSFPKIIEKVSTSIANRVNRPQVAEQLQKGGVEPVDVSPQQTALAMHLEGLGNTPVRSRCKTAHQHRRGATRGLHCISDKKLSLLIK